MRGEEETGHREGERATKKNIIKRKGKSLSTHPHSLFLSLS
jgi:hypothetical protein